MNQSHDATCLPSPSSDNDGHAECPSPTLPGQPPGECAREEWGGVVALGIPCEGGTGMFGRTWQPWGGFFGESVLVNTDLEESLNLTKHQVQTLPGLVLSLGP